MWLHFALLLLVGAAFAEKDYAWKIKHEYRYRISSETLTKLDVKHQMQTSGIVIQATLIIQSYSPEILRAAITAAHYSHVGKVIDTMNTEPNDRKLNFKTFPLSKKPFEIIIKQGIIRDLKTAKDLPKWEINFIKSIVSQLHLDTKGEYAKKNEFVQMPTTEQPYGMFVTMEDSVGGKCEVLYDMAPMSEYEIQKRREMIPMPRLGEGNFIEIRKVKNYSNCEEQAGYYFGKIMSPFHTEDKFIVRSTTSRAIISGTLGSFTIQSSMMKNKIFVKPIYDWRESGIISSKLNLTLANINTEYKPLEVSDDLVSTKDLIFVYDKPFVDYQNSKFRNTKRQIFESSKEEDNTSFFQNYKNSKEKDSKDFSPFQRNSREKDWNDYSEELENREITADQDLDTPLVPYFISYMKNGKTNLTDVQKIVREITADFEDPDDVLLRKTLEKFSIFVNMIRSMNSKEITIVEKDLQLSFNSIKDDKNANRKMIVWKVFRDAVAQAGTGPALITIARWLREKKLVDLEAAMTVSRLSKSVGTLTPQYLKTFFEIVKDPNTSGQMFLRDTAIMVFGELIRDSKYRYNYLTRHIKGQKIREDPAIFDIYIPYMKEELQKAAKEGNNWRVMTYIRALGYTSNPKILSIFEPYLEGKWPMSKIQRTSIIASLNNLIKTSPKIVRSVLYKIYLNRHEAHEVRCMAVLLLMKTSPSLVMLQRMAESTNHDTDRNVNSMVQSVIENAAESNVFNDEDLSRKARIARRLLNSQHYSYRYSRYYVRNTFISENYIYKYLLAIISSDDIDIPKGLQLSMYSQFHGFHPPGTKIEYLMSSVKQLLDFFGRKFDLKNEDKKGSKRNLVEDIARALNIQSPDPQQLEGHAYFNSRYGLYFYAFDNHTLEKAVEQFKQYFLPWGKTQDININQMNTYEVEISLPTETGLPFFFSLKEPMLMRVQGRRQFDGHFLRGFSMNKAKVAISMTLAKQIQKTTGFLTPFEGRRYDFGFYTDLQFYVPVETEWEMSSETRTFELKFRPFTNKDKNRLLHHDTIPFFWFGDINYFQPRSFTKGYYLIRTEKPHKVFFKTDKLSVDLEIDNWNDRMKSIDYSDYYWIITKPLFEDDIFFSKFDLYWTDKDKNDWTVIKIVHDDVEIKTSNNYFSLPKIPMTFDMEANSEKRIERMNEELSKGFASGIAKMIDISVDIPQQGKGLLTMSLLNDETEKKMYSLLYGNIRSVEDKEDLSEVFVSLQSQSKPILSGLDVEEMLRNPPKEDFKLVLAFGNVTKGQQIKMEGRLTQNDNLRNTLMNSTFMKTCWEEMKKGNKGLRACNKVNSLAKIQNQLELSMNIESQYVNMLVDVLKSLSNKHMGTTYTLNTKNNEEQKIDMKLLLSPDFKKGDLSFSTPLLNVSLPYYSPLKYFTMLLGIPLNENSFNVFEERQEYENNEQEMDSCILDVNMARTFDDNVYPLKLGQYWYVMATTVPQMNPDNPNELMPIPPKIRVTVLVREKDARKEVKLIIGDKVIELKKTLDNSLQTMVNGMQLPLVKNKMHSEKTENRYPIDIMELEDGSVKIVDMEFRLVYDGQRVRIKMSSKFHNVISGLCGNYDLQPENDFLTPERCVEFNPEEFVASYVMTYDDYQEENKTNKYKDRSNRCIRITERQSNVISDVEAGRNAEELKQFGYDADKLRPENKRCASYFTKIIQTDDEVCFSIRPVLVCNEGCKSVEVKSKKYLFHCMPYTQATLQMKNRIEQGANPDMSRKTVHFSKIIDVPIACKAA